MKSPRAFLFFSMETQSRRRALVVAWYGFYAALFTAILCFWGIGYSARLLQLVATSAIFLGGISSSGPVRLFSRWQRKFADGTVYGINPNRPHPYLHGRRIVDMDRLRVDEDDIATRDRAHYLAYAALRWAVLLFSLFAPLLFILIGPDSFVRLLLVLCFPFCVLFFSLPQAIILWTEPDLEPDPEDPGSQTVYRAIP